jgi:hypothetical protein
MATERRMETSPISSKRLWFGLIASAVAWASLGFIDILITWRVCVHQEESGNPVAHPAARIIYVAIAVVLFLVVLTSGVTSYRNWRVISQQREILNAAATDRREFMALLGVFVSITLGVSVLWLAIPPLVIELCMRAR